MVDGGRFYRCGTQVNGVKLGVIPDAAEGSVDLSGHEELEARGRIRQAVQAFASNSEDFYACEFCEGATPWRETVPAAIQTERHKKELAR